MPLNRRPFLEFNLKTVEFFSEVNLKRIELFKLKFLMDIRDQAQRDRVFSLVC